MDKVALLPPKDRAALFGETGMPFLRVRDLFPS
jgi:hypothetical protein